MVALSKIKKLTHWLFEKPLANTIPSLYILDRIMITLIKITFIIMRILSKITFRKKIRKFTISRKCIQQSDVNFSFYLFMFFYKLINC